MIYLITVALYLFAFLFGLAFSKFIIWYGNKK